MKMKKEHYNQLSALIVDAIAKQPKNAEFYANNYQDQKLSTTRFRWDLFWSIDNKTRSEFMDNCGIYEYLNDDHINTALKSIVEKELCIASW